MKVASVDSVNTDQPVNLNHDPSSGRSSVWRVIVLIAVMPVLAIALAFALYASGWRSESTLNHGELLSPPVSLSKLQLRTRDGAAQTGLHFWQGLWSLVLLHDAPCTAACLEALEGLGRVRVSLPKNMERTRVVWLGRGAPSTPGVLPPNSRATGYLALETVQDDVVLPAKQGEMLLLNPQGYAVLRYDHDTDAKGIRADLQRLLKYSWIG